MRLRTLIREGVSAILTTTIQDLDGEPLGSADLDTLTLSLYDEPTRTIINERDDVDVLNANGGTLDADGNFELSLSADDTAVVDDAALLEWHIALLTWTWTEGADTFTGKAAIIHRVVNQDPTLASIAQQTGHGPFRWWLAGGWC